VGRYLVNMVGKLTMWDALALLQPFLKQTVTLQRFGLNKSTPCYRRVWNGPLVGRWKLPYTSGEASIWCPMRYAFLHIYVTSVVYFCMHFGHTSKAPAFELIFPSWVVCCNRGMCCIEIWLSVDLCKTQYLAGRSSF
jgi:hypothetical protein